MTVIRAFLVLVCTLIVAAVLLPAATADDVVNPTLAATFAHGALGAPGGVRENADVRAIRYSIRALMDEREEEESPQARAVRVLAAADAMLSAPLQGGGADAEVAAEEPRRSKNGGKKGERKGGKKGGKKGGTKGGNTRKDEGHTWKDDGHTGKDDDNKRKDAENKWKDEVNKQKDEENKRKDEENKRKDEENKRKDEENMRKDEENKRKDEENKRKDEENKRKAGGNMRHGGNTREDGGNTREDGGNTREDGGNTRKDGGNTRKDGGRKRMADMARVPAALLSPLTTPHHPSSPPPFSSPLTLHAPTPLALLSQQGSAGQWLWGEFSCLPAALFSPLLLTNPPGSLPMTQPQGSAWQWMWGCSAAGLPATPLSSVPLTTPHRSPSLCSSLPPHPTQQQGSAGQWTWGEFSFLPVPWTAAPSMWLMCTCEWLGGGAYVSGWEEELMRTHLFMHESTLPLTLLPAPLVAASRSARVGLAAVSLKALGPLCYPTTTTLHLTLPSPIPACIQERTCGAGSGLSESPGTPFPPSQPTPHTSVSHITPLSRCHPPCCLQECVCGAGSSLLKGPGVPLLPSPQHPTRLSPTPLTRPSVCPSRCCLQECTCGAGSGLSESPGAPLLCRGGFQSIS
ncbi:unnamed protein product [Closterium sp. NIES-65]|nr:unnamed protein product [Closterium sp. NIES-65]